MVPVRLSLQDTLRRLFYHSSVAHQREHQCDSVWNDSSPCLVSLLEKIQPYLDENERPKSASRSGAEAIPPGSYAKFPQGPRVRTKPVCVSGTEKYKNWFGGGWTRAETNNNSCFYPWRNQTPMACKSNKTEWLLLFSIAVIRKGRRIKKTKRRITWEFIMNGDNRVRKQTDVGLNMLSCLLVDKKNIRLKEHLNI